MVTVPRLPKSPRDEYSPDANNNNNNGCGTPSEKDLMLTGKDFKTNYSLDLNSESLKNNVNNNNVMKMSNNNNNGTTDGIQVVVRVRPPADHSPEDGSCLQWEADPTSPRGTFRVLTLPEIEQSYRFNAVLPPDVGQKATYLHCCKDLLSSFTSGYNCCVMAYGQTGSGKTFTLGTAHGSINGRSEDMGIVPRAMRDIYSELKSREESWNINITCTYIEIYNEEVRDLLDPEQSSSASGTSQFLNSSSPSFNPDQSRKMSIAGSLISSAGFSNDRSGISAGSFRPMSAATSAQGPIRIIQDSQTGSISITGVKSMPVPHLRDAMDCLQRGCLYRKTESNKLNLTSSRSHAILTLTLVQSEKPVANDNNKSTDEEPVSSTSKTHSFVVSKFHFVDLAGSERVKRTQAAGDRLKEGININSGLLALSNVINALSDEKFNASHSDMPTATAHHVPYRVSKLTRLLQDSLGGNSKTIIIACVSPCSNNFAETYSTIRYATRARRIKNAPIVNKDPQTLLVENLKQKVKELTSELLLLKSGGGSSGGVGTLLTEDCDQSVETIPTVNLKSSLEFNDLMEEKGKRLAAEAHLLKVLQDQNEMYVDGDERVAELLNRLSELEECRDHNKHLEKTVLKLSATVAEQKCKLDHLENLESAKIINSRSEEQLTTTRTGDSNFSTEKMDCNSFEDGDQRQSQVTTAEKDLSMLLQLVSDEDREALISTLEHLSGQETVSETLKDQSERITISIKRTDELLFGMEKEKKHWESVVTDLSNQINLLKKQLSESEFAKSSLISQLEIDPSQKTRKDSLAVRQDKESDKDKDRSTSIPSRLNELTKELDRIKKRRGQNQQRIQDLQDSLQNLKSEKVQIQKKIQDQEKRHRLALIEKDKLISRLQKETKRSGEELNRVQQESKSKMSVLQKKNEELNKKLVTLQKQSSTASMTSSRCSRRFSVSSLQWSPDDDILEEKIRTLVFDITQMRSEEDLSLQLYHKKCRKLDRLEKEIEKWQQTVSNLDLEASKLGGKTTSAARRENLVRSLTQAKDKLELLENQHAVTKKAVDKHLKDKLPDGSVKVKDKDKDKDSKEGTQTDVKSFLAELKIMFKANSDLLTDVLLDMICENNVQNREYVLKNQQLQYEVSDIRNLNSQLVSKQDLLIQDFGRQKLELLLSCNKDKLSFMEGVFTKLKNCTPATTSSTHSPATNARATASASLGKFTRSGFSSAPNSPGRRLTPTAVGSGGNLTVPNRRNSRQNSECGSMVSLQTIRVAPSSNTRATFKSDIGSGSDTLGKRTKRSQSLSPGSARRPATVAEPTFTRGKVASTPGSNSFERKTFHANRQADAPIAKMRYGESGGVEDPNITTDELNEMSREWLVAKISAQETYYTMKLNLLMQRLSLMEKMQERNENEGPGAKEGSDSRKRASSLLDSDNDLLPDGRKRTKTDSVDAEENINTENESSNAKIETRQRRKNHQPSSSPADSKGPSDTSAIPETTQRKSGSHRPATHGKTMWSAPVGFVGKRRAQSTTPSAQEIASALAERNCCIDSDRRALTKTFTLKEKSSSHFSMERHVRDKAESQTLLPDGFQRAHTALGKKENHHATYPWSAKDSSDSKRDKKKVANSRTGFNASPTRDVPRGSSGEIGRIVRSKTGLSARLLSPANEENPHGSTEEAQEAALCQQDRLEFRLNSSHTFDRLASDSDSSSLLRPKCRVSKSLRSDINGNSTSEDENDDEDNDDEDDEYLKDYNDIDQKSSRIRPIHRVRDAHSLYIKSACVVRNNELASGSLAEVKLWDLNRLFEAKNPRAVEDSCVFKWRNAPEGPGGRGIVNQIIPCESAGLDRTLAVAMGSSIKLIDIRAGQAVHSWSISPPAATQLDTTTHLAPHLSPLVHSMVLLSRSSTFSSDSSTTNNNPAAAFICASASDTYIRLFDIRKTSHNPLCRIPVDEEILSLGYMPAHAAEATRKRLFTSRNSCAFAADAPATSSRGGFNDEDLNGLVAGGRRGTVWMWSDGWAILPSSKRTSPVNSISIANHSRFWSLLGAYAENSKPSGWFWDTHRFNGSTVDVPERREKRPDIDEISEAGGKDMSFALLNMCRFWSRHAVSSEKLSNEESSPISQYNEEDSDAATAIHTFSSPAVTITGTRNGELCIWDLSASRLDPVEHAGRDANVSGGEIAFDISPSTHGKVAVHARNRSINAIIPVSVHTGHGNAFITIGNDTQINLWTFCKDDSKEPMCKNVHD